MTFSTPPQNVPVPDPSALTEKAQKEATEQSRHELDQEIKLVDFRLNRLRADHEQGKVFHDESQKHAMDLVDEKIRGVCQSIAALETRFTDADTAHDARSKLIQDKNQEALNISFTAQEKLNTVVTEGFKSEIYRVASTTNEQIKSLEAQLQGLKERIDKNEGTIAGETAAQITARANLMAQVAQANNQQGARANVIMSNAQMTAWVVAALSLIGLVVTIIIATRGK